jgi:hypothetical protein
MTVERKWILKLKDVKAITFQCARCEGRISVSPTERGFQWPATCPMGHRWEFYETERKHSRDARFLIALQDIVTATDQESGFNVLLEFDEPKL